MKHEIPLVDDVDLSAWALTPNELSRISTPSNVVDEYKRMKLIAPETRGQSVGLPGTEKIIRLLPGTVTVWTGVSFHGKTTLLKQVEMHLMDVGERVFVASLEERPVDVFGSYVRSISRVPHLAPEWSEMPEVVANWLAGKCWFYGNNARLTPDQVLGLIHYAAEKLKCTHIVIDSLMKLKISTDDFSAQSDLVNNAMMWAEKLGVHVHLVAHPMKGTDDDSPVGRHKVRGSGDITNLAGNVFSVWRNTAEERQQNEPDGVLLVDKQRGDIDWRGKVNLFFDTASRQFLTSPNATPRVFIPMYPYDFGDGTPPPRTPPVRVLKSVDRWSQKQESML